MKIIAFIGDSHTFGEGVGGEFFFSPKVVAGDLRKLPFNTPGYVNLIRDYYSLTTNSKAKDYSEESLTRLFDKTYEQCGVVTNEFKISERFSLCRIFFRAQTEKATAQIQLNGKCVKTLELITNDDSYSKNIRVANVFSGDGESPQELKIICADGKQVLVERMEFYSGDYAIINCGFGSCPIGKLMDVYFDDYVADLNPYAAVIECCTINDWLTKDTLDVYKANLESAVGKIKSITQKTFMHTVFPISENQVSADGNNVYDDYIDCTRQVAKEYNIPLADCNKTMREYLEIIPEERKNGVMYHDKWHPNALGHIMYAKDIIELIKNEI